ncbi:MAG: serine/threonine-protein kinase [Gemmatimonadales bacterium]
MIDPGFDADFLGLQGALRGEYSLEREIGRGGMGVVYLARDVALDRPVAIKVLPSVLAAATDVRARFLREARTAAQLSHPNVVPIHRADERAGFTFFVMAWVDGESLGERIRRRGPLSPPLVARMLREVAWALAYASARGIVHRDVKPDNILLERDTGRAMVTDFGIAQVADGAAGLTAGGAVLGSVHFMSPEQAAGEPLDGRSDLYALGVVGYYALSGRLPFEGDSVQAVMAKHITQPAPPLDVPAAPQELTKAIERALAKRPADRFATGEEFAAALASAARVSAPVPVAVRAWLRPSTAAVVATAGTYVVLAADWVKVGTEMLGLFVFVPISMLLGVVVRDTRAAFAAGFSLDDLRRAIRDEVKGRAEERQYVVEAGRIQDAAVPAWVSKYYSQRGTGSLSLMLTLVLVVALAASSRWGWGDRSREVIFLVFGLMAAVFTTIGISGTAAPEPSTDIWHLPINGVVDRLRAMFWSSWGGAAVGALARIGLSRRAAPASARPTEEVIGLAVSDLLATLPRDLRRRFASARDVAEHLERAAVALRSRGDQPERLALVVSALENIRLDLLRLHAGKGQPDSLETVLSAGEELGREVRRVLEARAETEALLSRTPKPR